MLKIYELYEKKTKFREISYFSNSQSAIWLSFNGKLAKLSEIEIGVLSFVEIDKKFNSWNPLAEKLELKVANEKE